MKRLDQLLSNLGVCSRREVRYFIRDERVRIDGELVRSASIKVNAHQVMVDEQPLDHPDGILVMLHKPLGYVCTHDDSEGLRIYDLLPARWLARDPKIVSVGRLDKDTSGLILVTDKTAMVHQMTAPKNHVEKIYRAHVDKDLSAEVIAQFAAGVALRGEAQPCLPAELKIIEERVAQVTLCEGKYHQVRRMFAACGYQVEQLHRSSFAGYSLADLATGQWQDLPIPAR